MLVLLLDFGFRPSFARNISYIFSGVKMLHKEGVEHVEHCDKIDYSLLKGTLIAMRSFYRRMSVVLLLLLATAGTAYMWYIFGKYDGDRTDALTAWGLLIVINCYNLYTLYYDALLLGKGYVKRSQQITIIGQTLYLLTAIGLIYAGFGLTAIVLAQTISVVIRRILSRKVFFTPAIKKRLAMSSSSSVSTILQAIVPNAVKVGLTSLGGFCVNKSALLIGSACLDLTLMASFGITMQVLELIGRCGTVVYQSYTPKLAQYRTEHNLSALKRLYGYSVLSLFLITIAGGVCFVLFGDWALQLIGSRTTFLPLGMMLTMILIHFLEQNHAVAAGFIMADNKIPFFIPSLLSGAATIVLLCISLWGLKWGVWGLILSPGIAQLAYQNWKWPMVVIKELRNK